jgi:hypothetical protein
LLTAGPASLVLHAVRGVGQYEINTLGREVREDFAAIAKVDGRIGIFENKGVFHCPLRMMEDN